MSTDNRLHPRFPVTQRCWCETNGTTMYVTMHNICARGAFLKTVVPLPVGYRAMLRWQVESGHRIEVEAEVVWNSKTSPNPAATPGMGLRFVSIKEGETSLDSYLSSMHT